MKIRVRDLLSLMENGACHVLLFDTETGEKLISTIWYNEIEEEWMDMNVESICVRDYEMRLKVRKI